MRFIVFVCYLSSAMKLMSCDIPFGEDKLTITYLVAKMPTSILTGFLLYSLPIDEQLTGYRGSFYKLNVYCT